MVGKISRIKTLLYNPLPFSLLGCFVNCDALDCVQAKGSLLLRNRLCDFNLDHQIDYLKTAPIIHL